MVNEYLEDLRKRAETKKLKDKETKEIMQLEEEIQKGSVWGYIKKGFKEFF